MEQWNRRKFLKNSLMTGAGALAIPSLKYGYAQSFEAPFFVFVHCDGGWDPTMVFDNQLSNTLISQEAGATLTAQGNIQFVSHTNRPSVDAFFMTHGDNTAVINGINTRSMSRNVAIEQMLGTTPYKGNKPVDWLSYYAANMNPLISMPHLVKNGPYMAGEYQSSTVLLTDELVKNYLSTADASTDLGEEGEKSLADFIGTRQQEHLNSANSKSLDYEKTRAISASRIRDNSIGEIVKKIEEDLGPQTDESDFLRAALFAAECMKNGYSQCATLRAGQVNSWNTTTNNYTTQSNLFENLFSDLDSFLTHASKVNIGESTLAQRLVLIVTSESGRNPQLNELNGKSKWPYTSALVWSPLINGNATIGSTDTALRGEIMNPLVGTKVGSGDEYITMKHLMSALYLSGGLSASKILTGINPLMPIVRTS